MRERRLKPKKLGPSTELPVDYVKQVQDVFTTQFDETLKVLKKLKYPCSIHASGEIYPEEIVLRISLLPDGKLAATTFHASHDYDPKASAPKAEEVLAACIDVVASYMVTKLDTEDEVALEKFVTTSLNELEDVPFDWTEVKAGRFKVYLRFDRAHPGIDKMTDEWLKKNDPDYEENLKKEEAEVVNVFKESDDAAAPRNADLPDDIDDDQGSGTIH